MRRSNPLKTEYYLCGQRDYRQEHREVILEHLLTHHPPGPIKLLSFPGVAWAGELRLLELASAQRVQLVGLEASKSLYELAQANMPGTAVGQNCRVKNGASMPLLVCSKPAVHLVNCRASRFLRLCGGKQLPPELSWPYSAIWLDFTGCLGEEIFQSCRELATLSYQQATPFVAAFSVGRERGEAMRRIRRAPEAILDAVDRRAHVLQQLITTHHQQVLWATSYQYRSPTGTTIGYLRGVFTT